MLFEVKLVINNVPLTYVYTNPIETCLTHNHLVDSYLTNTSYVFHVVTYESDRSLNTPGGSGGLGGLKPPHFFATK